jgi:uncharacterized membrane protein
MPAQAPAIGVFDVVHPALHAGVELIILTRVFDLLAWLLPKAERFPRVHRFTVTQRTMNAALDLQEALFEAQTQRGGARVSSLRTADTALNKLRLYLRLAHHWRWLSESQYYHVSKMVAEVGRMLGGWLKQADAHG